MLQKLLMPLLMSGGEAAGPDGLPVDIYKIFKDKLKLL